MLINPDFKLEGSAPAEALGWDTTIDAAGLFASYADYTDLRTATEAFSWFPLANAFTPVLADFDARADSPKAFEDFEDLWGARNARLLSGKEAPFVLQPGMTLTLRVNGGEPRTVTFQAADFANIADARAEEVARVIDRGLEDADAFMAPGGRGVVIMTTAAGYATTLQVTGGTAAALFNFPASARGTDEEGGTFFKRAEFDLMNDAKTNAEYENFERAWVDAKVEAFFNDLHIPDLRYDPLDRLSRFTLRPVEPFQPDVFLMGMPVLAEQPDPETFAQSSWPGETLTTNFV